jgi:hypothetical protein
MNRILAVAVAIVCGLVVLLDFFLPIPEIDLAGRILVEGVTILAVFGLLQGLLNLLSVHGQHIIRGEGRRGLSGVLILAMLSTLAVGVLLPAQDASRWVFDHLYVPLQSTMTALLAFFAISAAYRSLRIRHIDALILMIVSLFMLFTQLPFGQTLWPELSAIRDWLLAIPVTAGTRGILLGVALGTIATALRVLLAVDQAYVGE